MTIIPTFILLSGLILWFVIGTKGYWSLKMALITLTVCFSMFLSTTINDLRGWPHSGSLPEQFRVHWIVIKEPSKTDAVDKGGIYLWVTYSGVDKRVPRAYKLTYAKKIHEDAQDALKLLKEGKGVLGGKGVRRGDGDGTGGNKGHGQDNGTGGGSTSESPEIIFHELPPPLLPKK